MYKSIHVTFVFWVPKTPPTPYMSGTFVLAPPPLGPMCLKKNDIIKYNPFYEIVNSDSQESDKFYETEPSEYLENLQELSNIL